MGSTKWTQWAIQKKEEEEKDKKLERVRRSGVIREEAGREMGGIMTKLYASIKELIKTYFKMKTEASKMQSSGKGSLKGLCIGRSLACCVILDSNR